MNEVWNNKAKEKDEERKISRYLQILILWWITITTKGYPRHPLGEMFLPVLKIKGPTIFQKKKKRILLVHFLSYKVFHSPAFERISIYKQ